MGLSRDSYRNPPVPDQQSATLSAAIIDIAHVRRRFGYRRIHDLLRPEFPNVNHKRMYRLYSVADLAVRKRKKAKRPTNERVPLQIAQRVNEVWSMDFVSDNLVNSGRIKCLNDQWFETLPQARAAMALWRQDDSENRPHSSC